MALFERAEVQAALPGYEIGEVLGRGSSGLVLAARHRHIRRPAAVKILTAAADATSGEDRAGFRREADVLAGLDHPHIVRIYDYVERDDLSLLVMESLPGDTLSARLAPAGATTVPAQARGLVPATEACGLVLAAADALAAAHRAGVLHRDVKPTNMMFAADGTLKLVDFGISKFFRAPGTSVTTIAGTPGYMAPEQLGGGRVGPGTDLYALGVVLYRLLTGALPFDPSLPPLELWRRQRSRQVSPPAGVAPQLAAFLPRALAPRLEDRFGNARDFALALAQAAHAAFGPEWLERSGAVVRIDREIVDAARGHAAAGAPGLPRGPVAEPPSPESPASSGPPADDPATDEGFEDATRRVDPPAISVPSSGAPREQAGDGTRALTPGVPPSQPPHPAVLEQVRPEPTPTPTPTPKPKLGPGPEPGATSGDPGELVIEPDVVHGPHPRMSRRSAAVAMVIVAAVAIVAAAGVLAAPALWPDRPGATGDSGAGPSPGELTPATSPAGVVALREQPLGDGLGAQAEDVAISPDGVRVVVGRRTTDRGTEPAAWRSLDNASWTPVPVTSGGSGGGMAAVTFLPGHGFVAVGAVEREGAEPTAAVWTSLDGTRWEPAAPGPWPAPTGAPMGELGEVVTFGGKLLAVGRGGDPRETDRFWRSSDAGASWEELAVTGLDGPSEQHVTKIVEAADGRLLGAGAQPEAGTSVTPLRWSDNGTDWHLATTALPANSLVRGLACLASGRILAVGTVSAADGRMLPLVSLADPGANRWDGYTAQPATGRTEATNLLGVERAGDDLLVVGAVSGGAGQPGRAAVWSIQPPSRPTD